MESSDNGPLVEVEWLNAHLEAPDVVVLDASWHLPTMDRSGQNEFEAKHIPGAQFFDIDAISDTSSSLPHMLPETAEFARAVERLGIGDGVRVVVYDADGIFAAPRVWWMLRVMGHDDVRVLNGGLKAWQAAGFATSDAPSTSRAQVRFTPRRVSSLVADKSYVQKIIDPSAVTSVKQVVDARPAPRFDGLAAEPRPGLKCGHIPGSFNVPFGDVLTADGTLKDAAALKAVFEAAGVDVSQPAVATCGSGVTASILALALASLGNWNVSVYDGSFAEWGVVNAGLPVTTA